jgi:hypothetical protein
MASAPPTGWRRVNRECLVYLHDGPPMMMVRRRPHGDGRWWVSVRLHDAEWHSYGHRTARAAMLAGSTLAALWSMPHA